ncbi:MAG: hypothetical protein JST00_41585 [Deltaproteobacteria bacterium]|nr:hypothetical protein [Deltaproteobacteria bacterium]
MTKNARKTRVSVAAGLLAASSVLAASREARADDATVTVGDRDRDGRFSEPPPDPSRGPITQTAILPDDAPRYDHRYDPREPKRAPFRLQLGPMGITTGKGFGVGVGVGADFGTGSVGGRLSASWLRGEGTNSDGTSTPTGSSIGLYTGEITLDLHKRGPFHPIVGMGAGLVSVSRVDASGFAGVGTSRLALEYALGLEDADVRIGVSVTGGLIGPVDPDVKDLRAYALTGIHLAIGF